MRYAIVISGVVENVIQWDGVTNWEPPMGAVVLALAEGQECGPGWIWDGIQFTEGLP